MIVTQKDKDDKIIAYGEYNIVDRFGHPTEVGQYCFIYDTWVHKDYRHRRLLKDMIRSRMPMHPTVKWIYWTRSKHEGKTSMYELKRFGGK